MMTEKIIVAVIGAGGVVIAALIALLKRDRKKEASTPSQSTGPIVQGSRGVVIATQGGTVIQHTSPAQFERLIEISITSAKCSARISRR
jgi:hypothetical protein